MRSFRPSPSLFLNHSDIDEIAENCKKAMSDFEKQIPSYINQILLFVNKIS